MSPNIVWTRRAEERLGTALRRTPGPAKTLAAELAAIAQRLTVAFPRAAHVIVLNYFVGFKHRPNEHILQVDERQPGKSHTFVVKLADHERLSREQTAWALCNLTDANPVFMPVLACPEDGQEPLIAIAYQDAQQHIGAEETIWLETAIQRCVRFGSPALDSILDVLHDVYAQLGRLYDRSGRLEPPNAQGIQTVPLRQQPGERHPLRNTLARWEEPDPRTVRRQVASAFTVGSSRFFEPVDYYHYLDLELAGGTSPTEVVPALLRGLAHGDLHGRNSLVGIDEAERANFPTLFDYESINADNLIGWDFVEMETELKIRLYEKIFPAAKRAERARQVAQFEWELTEATRNCHETNQWPPHPTEAKTPLDRLRTILLKIREEAAHALGRLRAESIEWLREYLFLLGCYGLSTVRYTNQTPAHRAAAFVSAGVAAAYLESIRGPRAAADADVAALLAARHPTYQLPLAVARTWSRSKNPDERRQGEHLLIGLVAKYPTALHVWYEHAFNLTKQGRVPDALQLLLSIHTAFDGRLDEDTFSLWGRCYKDPGDRHLEIGQKSDPGSADQESAFREAEEAYRDAVKHYTNAYLLAGGFFPGINVATLTFLRAGLCERLDRREEARRLREESQRYAQTLLDTSAQWLEVLPDDAIWKRATEAEAAMLCRNFDRAIKRYEAALAQAQCQQHHSESMGKQLRRIFEGYRLLNEAVALEPFKKLTLLWPYLQPETSS